MDPERNLVVALLTNEVYNGRADRQIAPLRVAGLASQRVAVALDRAFGSRARRVATQTVTRLRSRQLRRAGLWPPAEHLRTAIPLINRGFVEAVLAGDIQLHGAFTGVDGTEVSTASGPIQADALICATGYVPDAEGLVAGGNLSASSRVHTIGLGDTPTGHLLLAQREAVRIAAELAELR